MRCSLKFSAIMLAASLTSCILFRIHIISSYLIFKVIQYKPVEKYIEQGKMMAQCASRMALLIFVVICQGGT